MKVAEKLMMLLVETGRQSPFFNPDMPKPAYDKLMNDLAKLFSLLEIWTNGDAICAMLVAGRTDMFWMSNPIVAYDIVERNAPDHVDDPREVGLCGFTRQEIRNIALGLSNQFPSLGLEGIGDEFWKRRTVQALRSTMGAPTAQYLISSTTGLKERAAHIPGE